MFVAAVVNKVLLFYHFFLIESFFIFDKYHHLTYLFENYQNEFLYMEKKERILNSKFPHKFSYLLL